jgi:hypothetical protein
MMTSHEGRVGAILAIPVTGQIGAIGFTCEVGFEFRLIRDGAPAALPMAIAGLAHWQIYRPRHSPPCYTTLYAVHGGTKGLDATGLAIETQGLAREHTYVLFVWGRH